MLSRKAAAFCNIFVSKLRSVIGSGERGRGTTTYRSQAHGKEAPQTVVRTWDRVRMSRIGKEWKGLTLEYTSPL